MSKKPFLSKINIIFLLFGAGGGLIFFQPTIVLAEAENELFDDKLILENFTKQYALEPKENLTAMMQDDSLSAYKSAAAIRAFKDRFIGETFGREKIAVEKVLLKRMSRSDSIFVEVESMHALCRMDRYKYFPSMVPVLIQKLDHYNQTVNELAYESLRNLFEIGNNRPREARIVFNALRQQFFLTRKKLSAVRQPDTKLKQKLELLRWAVKILGTQELKKLPSEAINLL